MRSFKLIGLKRKIEIILPDEDFFAEHSHSYGRRKDKIWGNKIILQPILESLNDDLNTSLKQYHEIA